MNVLLIIVLAAGSLLLLSTSLAPLSVVGVLAVLHLACRDKYSIDNFFAACFGLIMIGAGISIIQMLF